MQTASPITVIRDCPAGPERVALVELSAVEALIREYNSALAIPLDQPIWRSAALDYAKANAALRLAQWRAGL